MSCVSEPCLIECLSASRFSRFSWRLWRLRFRRHSLRKTGRRDPGSRFAQAAVLSLFASCRTVRLNTDNLVRNPHPIPGAAHFVACIQVRRCKASQCLLGCLRRHRPLPCLGHNSNCLWLSDLGQRCAPGRRPLLFSKTAARPRGHR
jgi:hypothetical protein